MDRKKIEVFVVVDEMGNYCSGDDADYANEAYGENYGGDCRRLIRIELDVELPAITKLSGTVPATGEAVIAVVSEA